MRKDPLRDVVTVSVQNDRNAFFVHSYEGYVVLDKDFNFLDANELVLKSINRPREEVIGKNLVEISPGIKQTQRYQLYKRVLETGETLEIEEKIHPSLGGQVARIKAFKLGDGIGIVGSNVTELRTALSELDTFMYKSSHNMRGPIASSLGLLNVLQNTIKDNEDAQFYVEKIRNEVTRLDNLLKELVKNTSFSPEGNLIHIIDFEELLSEIKSELCWLPRFENIHFDQDIKVKGDFFCKKHLLQVVLHNVIENSIRYQVKESENAFVRIQVFSKNNNIHIVVTDNGTGIPKRIVDNVFGMFYRGTSDSTGPGLGLYTARNSVKMLNGKIKLESKQNKGTKVEIIVPNIIP